MSRPESESGRPSDLDSLLSLRTPPVDGSIGAPGGPIVASDGVVGELRQIDVDAIVPNEFQPRRRFDEDALASLTDSIRELGVLQPILVRPEAGTGLYELIAGERRWRAARRAGLPSVPAIVRSTEDLGSLEQAIVENLHREDLTALEEAYAYQQLVEDFALTQDQVAARVGKSRSAISNTLRLFQLPAAVQRMIGDGLLTGGHARAILQLPDSTSQVALAQRIVDEELSVRAAETAVKRAEAGQAVAVEDLDAGSRRKGGAPSDKSAGALEVERLLEERLATKVDVVEIEGNGRIVIRFADAEDLDRIYRLLSD